MYPETNPAPTKFRGVAVFMAGQTFIIPALSVRQFRDNYEKLTNPIGDVNENTITATFESFVPVIGLAIRRNYPDITDEQLWDMLDLATFKEVVAAIQNASGMREAVAGEAAPVAVN